MTRGARADGLIARADRWDVLDGWSVPTVVAAVVLGTVGLAAGYGGVGLIRDGMGMPADWADRLPFGSWVIGGVALVVTIAVLGLVEVLLARWMPRAGSGSSP